MKGNPNKWQKLGRIICPKDEIPWMSTFAGPAFAKCTDQSSVFEIIMAGRDRQNRSQLGAFKVNLNTPTESYDVTPEPIFSFGELGAFDENGVSYPWVVTQEKKIFYSTTAGCLRYLLLFKSTLVLQLETKEVNSNELAVPLFWKEPMMIISPLVQSAYSLKTIPGRCGTHHSGNGERKAEIINTITTSNMLNLMMA